MTKHVDFEAYTKFVDAVTSDESRDFVAFSDRIVSLDEKGANIERLLTGAVGMRPLHIQASYPRLQDSTHARRHS